MVDNAFHSTQSTYDLTLHNYKYIHFPVQLSLYVNGHCYRKPCARRHALSHREPLESLVLLVAIEC